MPNSPDHRVTLEDLLKLKRHEEPEPAFWDRFERDFEQRRLRALMSRESTGVLSFGLHWMRQTGWAFGALAAALAVAFIGLSRFSSSKMGETLVGSAQLLRSAPGAATLNEVPAMIELASLSDLSEPSRGSVQSEPRFVVDVISDRPEPDHYRRVLSNTAFFGGNSGGTEFVADALTTSGRPRATFLVERPRAQF